VGNRYVLGVIDRWCWLVNGSASHVVVLSPGFKELLAERGLGPDNVSVVYNWCEEEVIRPHERDEGLRADMGLQGRFNFMFAGNMGAAQGLETVLAAARIVEARAPNVQFVFVGQGVESENLKRSASAAGLSDVKFLPGQPHSSIARTLPQADVLLVHAKPDPLFRITVPSKTQAYLAVGRPILMAVAGDAAALVTVSGGGCVCPPGEPEALAHVVCQMQAMPESTIRAMGERAASYYREHLSLSSGGAKFSEIFRRVHGAATRTDS